MARIRTLNSNSRVSRSLYRKDFACNCGCGFDTVDTNLVVILQKFINYIGRPIKINSGCRCAKRNAESGGVSKSQHMRGRACDFEVPPYQKMPQMSDSEICSILDKLFGDSIFYYRVDEHNGTHNKRVVHCDSGSA